MYIATIQQKSYTTINGGGDWSDCGLTAAEQEQEQEEEWKEVAHMPDTVVPCTQRKTASEAS